MIYYIKQDENLHFITMKIEGDICRISIKPHNNAIKRITKKMKKKQIEQVVLSRQMKKNKEIVNELNNSNITILDGKWLMQYMIKEIIIYLKQKDKINGSDEIAVLVDNMNNEVITNIKELANNYKKVRIVSNNLRMFEKIENDLFDNKGISIIISNNKRKALINSSLIVNFDFSQEVIEQYAINEKAIIINMNDNIKINKKRFCGFVTTDYEVEFENENKNSGKLDLVNVIEKKKEFSLKEILEEQIYNNVVKLEEYNTFDEVRKIIEEYNIHIKELRGINGILE